MAILSTQIIQTGPHLWCLQPKSIIIQYIVKVLHFYHHINKKTKLTVKNRCRKQQIQYYSKNTAE